MAAVPKAKKKVHCFSLAGGSFKNVRVNAFFFIFEKNKNKKIK